MAVGSVNCCSVASTRAESRCATIESSYSTSSDCSACLRTTVSDAPAFCFETIALVETEVVIRDSMFSSELSTGNNLRFCSVIGMSSSLKPAT